MPTTDEIDHRREAARIEHLLDDLRSLAAGPVWQRIEELVRRLVQLYGTGLTRWAQHLGEGVVDGGLADRVAGDELLASLLLLHGLHPWSLARRVEVALDRSREPLHAHLGEVVVLGIEGAVVHAHVERGAAEAAPLVLRALRELAPEIERVEIEGAPVRSAPLLQIGLPRTPAGGASP